LLIKNYLKLFLYSVVLIPVSATDSFLDLHYSKGNPNIVHLEKVIKIDVNNSASPLFYKFEPVQKIKSIQISGEINIIRAIKDDADDSYFQLGIIYEGDYRPNRFVKVFLPEWLKKVLSLNDQYGVGTIDFHEASIKGKVLDKSESVRDIKLNFKTTAHLSEKNSFQMNIVPEDKKILGFWFRSDGDDSQAKFQTQLNSLMLDI